MEQKIPRHIAIIMDGNRRWASKRNFPVILGHRAGVRSVDLVSEACARKGVEGLTLYGFSTENWKRESIAVKALFALIEKSLKDYLEKITRNNIRLKVIGKTGELPDTLRKNLEKVVRDTESNTGMVLTLALNYGGRQEIIEAVKRVYSEKGKIPGDFSEEMLAGHLYTSDIPDPDLVIRTSGEKRISNFLLWQAAYSELYFTDVLWPDFGVEDLEEAIADYSRRVRRFGG